MSGIGSFDRTGRIGSSLKSGLKNYVMGQLMRGVGGGTENLQASPFRSGASFGERFQGFGDASKMGSGFGKYFSSPVQEFRWTRRVYLSDSAKAQGQLAKDQALANSTDLYAGMGDPVSTGMDPAKLVAKQAKAFKIADLPGLVKKNLMAAGLGNNLMTGLLVGGLGAGALMGNMTEDEILDVYRGEGLDVEGIRTEVLAAMKDPSGDALKAIRVKYPFFGRQRY